jgi:acyl-CoA synthetase (NDP forming)
MKLVLTIFLGVFAATVHAQTNTTASPVKPAPTNTVGVVATPSTESSISVKAMQSLEQTKPVPPPPNEIRTEKGTVSGVIPQAVKTDNPLQLVNPAAPKEYGEAKDNTVVDPRTGQAQGIKLFSFSWFSSDRKKAKRAAAQAEAESKR